jgi:hypothetical protein
MLVRERLGETPLLAQGVGHKTRKKKRRAANAVALAAARRASLSGLEDGGGPAGSDRMSLVSEAYTYKTSTTFQTKASQPDFMRLPSEYEKVLPRFSGSALT